MSETTSVASAEVKAEIVPSNPVKAEAVPAVEPAGSVKTDSVKTDSVKPWYESVSDEYKTEASKYKTVDEFAKSKKDIQDLLNKKMDTLTDDEFEIYKQRLHKSMGIPVSRDEYNINTIANSREEISRVSEEALENIKETAAKHGMTNAQAQAVYDMANALYMKEEKELSDYFGKSAEATKQILQGLYGKEFAGHAEKIQKYVAQAANMYDIKDIYGVDNDLVMTGELPKETSAKLDRGKYDALFFAMCERHDKMVREKSQGWVERSDAPYASKRRIETFMMENNHIMRNASHPDYSKVRQAYQDLMSREYQNQNKH